MTIIELSFRGESVFMTKNDITGLIDDVWFISTLVNMEFNEDPYPGLAADTKNNLENKTPNKIEINEDKDTAMSLIETMRFNRLIVLPKVSLDYMLALSKKWCLPDNIEEMIEYRITNNINTNKFDDGIYNNIDIHPVDKLVFKCDNCKTGFKMCENRKNSCLSHSKIWNTNDNVFMCCGGDALSTPCTLGYHCLSSYDMNSYIKYKVVLK